MDELRRLLAAGRHAEEGAHPELAALDAVEHLHPQPAALADVGGHPGQVRGVDVVGRRVDEVAREPRRQREHLAAAGAVAGLAAVAAVGLGELQRLDQLVVLLALVAVERVGAKDRALDDRLGALAHRQPVAENLDGHRAGAEITGPAQAGGRRPAQRLGRRLGALAETDHHHAARRQPAVGVHVRHLADLGAELLRLQHVGQRAAAGLVDAGRRLAQGFFLGVHADDDRVGLDRGQRPAHDAHVHRRPSAASASARRIMSISPSVVSNVGTSSTSTHWASSTSVAAHSVPDSGNAT